MDEDHAGELYETTRQLLATESILVGTSTFQGPAASRLADAILEKIASDERSHKILLQVLTERLCP